MEQREGVCGVGLALCAATYLAALACESAKVKTRCRLAAYFARLIHL